MTDTKTKNLVVNTLSEEAYKNIPDPSETEIWLTPDITEIELEKKQDKIIAGTDLAFTYKTLRQEIPAEYDQLEYIEGTSNVQYINTGIIPNSSMEIYGKFGVASITSGASYSAFGSRSTSGQSDGIGIFIGTGSNTRVDSFFFLSNNNDRWLADSVTSVGDIYETTFSNSLQTLSKNGVSVGSHQYVSVSTTTQPMYINGLNNAGSLQSGQWGGRVYRFTVKGICDMIPARRKSDSVVGMYDNVRKQFFTNAGTGSFTAGPKIKTIPDGYTEIEYLESTGTQYIDTGFKPNQDSGFIIDYYANSTQQPRVFMIAQDIGSSSYGFGIVLGRGANIAVYNGKRLPANYWQCNDFSGTGRYTINVNKTAAVIKDSTGTRVTYTFPTDTFQLEYNLYLFTLNNGRTIIENTSSVRIYSCKLYDNGTLVRDFVPCLDNYNVPCLYDLVGEQTYYNAGTGEFVAGPSVGNLVLNFTNESGYIKAPAAPSTGTYVLKSINGTIQWVAE